MKKSLIILFVFISFNSYSQEKIMVATNAAETIIETYNKPRYNLIDEIIVGEYQLEKAYRLGPTSTKTLKEGIRTALKWIDLNATHQKNFEKEICRFMVMDKEEYKIHGYVEGFAEEMSLNFKGYSDGTFVIEIHKYNFSFLPFITFSDMDMIISFRDLLDGKSANKEIDDIFKK